MASYDSLSISTSKLSDDITTIDTNITSYGKAIETLGSSVKTIKENWTGDESGIMAAFSAKYTEAETALTELQTLLTTLKGVMSAKCAEFQQAEADARNLFA